MKRRLLRLVPRSTPKPMNYGQGPWNPISSVPIIASDNNTIARAKSILVSDVGVVDLTLEQARDVVAWYGER